MKNLAVARAQKLTKIRFPGARLLLRELRGGDAHASLADAVAALRDDARTAAVVRAVEAWLHAPTAGDRAQALDAIDRLRAAEKGMVAR